MAIMVGTGTGARHGILIKNGEALERGNEVRADDQELQTDSKADQGDEQRGEPEGPFAHDKVISDRGKENQEDEGEAEFSKDTDAEHPGANEAPPRGRAASPRHGLSGLRFFIGRASFSIPLTVS
jgi:hypothetical protein